MKSTSLYKLYELLAPEIRSRFRTLALVVLLASVTAFAAKAPVFLVAPLWDVIFPGSDAVTAVSGVDLNQSAGYQGFLAGFARVQTFVGHTLYGADPTVEQLRMAALWAVAAAMLLMTILGSAAIYTEVVVSRRLALELVVDLRTRIARHLMQLSMRYHGERKFGDLLSRVSSDVTKTLNVLNMTIKDVLQQPLNILFALIFAWTAAPLPTFGSLFLIPLAALPIGLLGKRVRKRSKKSLSRLGDSVEVLTQVFTGIRTVKAFRAEERELERYSSANQGYLKASMGMVRAVAAINSSSYVLSYLGFTVLVLLAGWFSIKKPLFGSAEQMMIFLGSVGSIYQGIKRFTSTINKIQESAGAADRLQDLLDERSDIVEQEGALRLESLGSGITLEDVSFTYAGSERPALAGVSLHVRPGETLALVGPSGAGKSTLVDLLARFLDPDQGRITAAGRDLRDLTLDSWTALYAMVGQVPFLFHDTLRENICYGKPGATQAEIEAAARAAHIHDFIAGLPAGYATVVGDVGSRLSGGQRQRITIARAILKGAPLLLLDEATSALDSESEAEVQRALEELRADRTVIVIAHRLSTIRDANRIAVLEEGRLVELGTHAELLEQGGAYARLHRIQFPEDREVSV